MPNRSRFSSHGGNKDIEITGDFLIVCPYDGCEDEVRTTIVGEGRGKEYINTKVYLGVYQDKVVEAYVEKVGDPRVFYGATLDTIYTRLCLDGSLQHFGQEQLMEYIRDQTAESALAPLGEGPGTYPESLETIAEDDRDTGVEDWEREREAGVPNGQITAAYPWIFHMRLNDIAAPLVIFGVGMMVAYFSVVFALVLLYIIR